MTRANFASSPLKIFYFFCRSCALIISHVVHIYFSCCYLHEFT